MTPDYDAAPWTQLASGTFPSWLPALGLKIDHVMSRGGQIVSAKTVRIPGSDHRAVIVDVSLDKNI